MSVYCEQIIVQPSPYMYVCHLELNAGAMSQAQLMTAVARGVVTDAVTSLQACFCNCMHWLSQDSMANWQGVTEVSVIVHLCILQVC